MQITVECYGVTARLTGGGAHALELASGALIGDALTALAARWPELVPVLSGCACAIGDAIVPRARPLAAGERLALLPPVSGG